VSGGGHDPVAAPAPISVLARLGNGVALPLALPAAFGALEAFVMVGSGRTLKPLESALDSPLAPPAAIAFAVPLVAAVTMAIGRRRRERATRPRPAPSRTAPGPGQA
jgi:hypothetical protein